MIGKTCHGLFIYVSIYYKSINQVTDFPPSVKMNNWYFWDKICYTCTFNGRYSSHKLIWICYITFICMCLWSMLCRLHIINSSSPGQSGHHFADDIFKCIFLNEKFCIFIRISLKSVPKGPFDNMWASVQVMAWRRTGDKPLPEPMLIPFTDAYMRH